MNIFDRILLEVAPGVAASRMKAKVEAMAAEKYINRSYDGATTGRRADSRPNVTRSANTEIGKDLKTLVNRSRNLFNNSPYSKRAVRSIANNVVGTGIIPTPTTKNKSIQDKLKSEWNKWADNITCDFDEVNNFYGLQKLVVKTLENCGSCIVIKKRVKSDINNIGLQVQVLDIDYLDITKNEDSTSSGGYIQNGIEYNSEGKRVKYWLFTRHPGDKYTESKPFKSEDVKIIFEGDRPSQSLGVPAAAVSLLKQNDLNDYEDAEIYGKKIAAAHVGIIVTPDPDKVDDAEKEDYDDLGNMRMEPGTFKRAAPGEDIRFNSPPLSSNYEPFVRSHLRAIAAGYEVTYEVLSNDYSQVNFSSGRMGWLEMQRTIEHKQLFILIPQFCIPVYNWFVDAIKVTTSIPELPDDFVLNWTTPRREMIDPSSETTAENNQLTARTKSWQESVRERGYNPDDVFREIQEDDKRFKDAGINVLWASVTQAPAGPANNTQK